jgi:hypothetical protein
MENSTHELRLLWQARLCQEYPYETSEIRQSIIFWILGEALVNRDCSIESTSKKFHLNETLTADELTTLAQKLDRRYKIWQERYFRIEPLQAYVNLINRLGALLLLCPQACRWIKSDCDRQKTLAQILPALLQDILAQDTYIARQIAWIAKCTSDRKLRKSFLFASLEEYCSHSIENRPLLVYRLINFLSTENGQEPF